MRSLLLILATAPGLIGCTRDSTAARKIAVDTVPAIDLTTANPDIDPLFERPAGATRLSNGAIVVADYWAATVMTFDSTGRLVRRVGGHGQGPDEFGGAVIYRGQCAPDSVFVLIFDKMQVAVLDTSGQVRRSFKPDYQFSGARCHHGPRVSGIHGQMASLPKPGDPPLEGELIAADFNGERRQSFGKVVIGEYGPGRGRAGSFVRDDQVFVSNPDKAEIYVYSIDGGARRTLALDLPRPIMTDAHFDAALDEFVTYLVLRDDRVGMKQMMRERFPKPSRLPAFHEFFVDRDRVLWVTSSPPGEPTVLHAYDADDATPAGVFHFPVELRILEIDKSHMLAAYEDNDGFPHVVQYRIMRNGSSPTSVRR